MRTRTHHLRLLGMRYHFQRCWGSNGWRNYRLTTIPRTLHHEIIPIVTHVTIDVFQLFTTIGDVSVRTAHGGIQKVSAIILILRRPTMGVRNIPIMAHIVIILYLNLLLVLAHSILQHLAVGFPRRTVLHIANIVRRGTAVAIRI